MTKRTDLPLNRQGLIKLMRQASHNRSLYDVFRDFTEMFALSISNAVDLAQKEEREKRYFEVIKPYGKEDLALFPQMMACLVGELETVEYDDVLGKTFMELELANKNAGQFFTPYELCKAMAQVAVDDSIKAVVAERGFVTVNDPAVGGGATLIAFCEAMHVAGLNPQTQLHVTAQDVDVRCVHMAYIQISLLNIPAVVECCNTISQQLYSRWYTPAHILGGWNWKMHNRRFNEIKQYERPEQAPPISPDVTLPPIGEQIALFPEAA